MTTIAQCFSVDEALLLRSVLAGSGIAAYVPDELTASTAPQALVSNPNGFRVQVEDEDVPAAQAVLAAPDSAS